MNYLFCFLLIALTSFLPLGLNDQEPEFRSPVEVKYSHDGRQVVSTDFTKGVLYIIDAVSNKVTEEVSGLDRPFGLVWVGDGQVAVAEYGSHRLAIIDVREAKILRRIECVKYPMGIAATGDGRLLVSGFGKSEVGIVDLKTNSQIARIPVWYQPDFIAYNQANNTAFVANLTPKDDQFTGRISMLNLKDNTLMKNIELPFGSTNVRQIVCSNDGRWVYVLHTNGKVTLPTSQLEKGWVNTNMVSIIEAAEGTLYASLPFDQLTLGAADPWGLVLSEDDQTMYVTLAGVHQLAILKLKELHEYLSGEAKPQGLRVSDANAKLASDVWNEVYENPENRMLLADQLSALYAAGLLRRYPLNIKGPRGIDISKDGKSLSVSGYYSGEIVRFDLTEMKVTKRIDLGMQPEPTLAREGEFLFHDGSSTLQGWLSCVSCHPAGRSDGLNWDLLNDGMGNPKNAKSLLLSHATPPSMSTGIRANYEVAVKAGFHFIKFNQGDEEMYNAVKAYLREMKPDPSPYLENGELSSSALRGEKLFRSEKAGCYSCHTGEYFTDQKMHNIGTRGKYDRTATFDTPSLIEVWRTAPYLHDGSVGTLEELLMDSQKTSHWHGSTKDLSDEEKMDLIQYVRSL